MSDHDHDEHGNCIIPPPNWRFSLWDIAGFAVGTAGAVMMSIGGGLQGIAREFVAAAAWERDRKDAAEAEMAEEYKRDQIAQAYEATIFGDHFWMQPEEDQKP